MQDLNLETRKGPTGYREEFVLSKQELREASLHQKWEDCPGIDRKAKGPQEAARFSRCGLALGRSAGWKTGGVRALGGCG